MKFELPDTKRYPTKSDITLKMKHPVLRIRNIIANCNPILCAMYARLGILPHNPEVRLSVEVISKVTLVPLLE